MRTLFIDTSSTDVSIVLLSEDSVISNLTKRVPNQHSVYTVHFISEVLEENNLKPADVEQIMVVNGPGSFTGIRIGVTIAKVYAYLRNIKVIPVSSLKMKSLSFEHDYALILIDAHHGNYYFGLYDSNNEEVMPEGFISLDRVKEIIDKYQPKIVCDSDSVSGYKMEKDVTLDFKKIADYYSSKKALASYEVLPNYLKKPQVLEKNDD